jgi:hypothetical protein
MGRLSTGGYGYASPPETSTSAIEEVRDLARLTLHHTAAVDHGFKLDLTD